MTKTKLFAAAAVMTSLMATPVLAQGMKDTSQKTSHVKKHRMNNAGAMNDDRAFNDRGYQRADSGFFPVDAAAGIVGGAVATAGAIATAPFGGPNYAYNDGYRYNDGYGYRTGYRDSYAAANNYGGARSFATGATDTTYGSNNNGWNNGWAGQSYAQRNGFICVPGTVYTNDNGIRTLCQ